MLQHTATHCNSLRVNTSIQKLRSTLQHTATHCNALQRTATHCKTLQHTATHCNTLQAKTSIQIRVTHCNTLQHTATHCNTLQHITGEDEYPEAEWGERHLVVGRGASALAKFGGGGALDVPCALFVVMCCSVLQYVAACCSVLLQLLLNLGAAVLLTFLARYLLQHAAVCCSVLQRGASVLAKFGGGGALDVPCA